jgi:hypothetical protein
MGGKRPQAVHKGRTARCMEVGNTARSKKMGKNKLIQGRLKKGRKEINI